jgi:hypothetical protein
MSDEERANFQDEVQEGASDNSSGRPKKRKNMVAPPQAAFLKTIRIQGSQGTRDVSKKVDHDGTAAKIDSLRS